MSKYINADALKANVKEMEVFVDANDFGRDIDYHMLTYLLERIEKSLIDIIDNMEAADVAPVVYAEWGMRRFAVVCNRCHKDIEVERGDAELNFCPNCGARMMNA